MLFFVFHVNGRQYFDNLVVAHSIWKLRDTASYRKTIQPDDKVLFYLAGQGNQVFLGAATLKSGAYKDETHESDKWYEETNMLRIDLKDLIVFSEPKSRFGLEWHPQMGAASRITEQEFNKVIGAGPAIESAQVQSPEAQEFAPETHLEEFIVKNWQSVFGSQLVLHTEEDGVNDQQYPTDVGYIDLLARDPSGNFVVIELKKGRKNDEVVGQVLRYMGWVHEKLATGKVVTGLVITKDPDEKLSYALKEIGNKVELKNYQVSFKLI